MRFNAIQEIMANHHEGPAAFFATAGSGKTSGIVENICRKLASGIPGQRILVTTFNKDACTTLTTRLSKLIGAVGRTVTIKTTHSLCWDIMKAFGSFSMDMLPDYQAKKVLKETMEKWPGHKFQMGEDNKMLYAIGYLKNHLCWYEDVPEVTELTLNLQDALMAMVERTGYDAEMIISCYRALEVAKKEWNKIEFDDMLLQAYWILRTNQEAREYYQGRYDYLIIDEYQDTNEGQYRLFKMLSARHQNIVVVGDDDQSIYAFRGSYPRYIQQFLEDYPNCVHVPLGENYRCQAGVVTAASALIGNNTQRYPKEITANKAFIRKPIHVSCSNAKEEAKFIAASIACTEFDYGQIAILTRLNKQQVFIEEALMERNIPYYVLENTTFFKRKEIETALDYLEVARSHLRDIDRIKRIANKPYRKLSNEFLNAVKDKDDLKNNALAYNLLAGLLDLEYIFHKEYKEKLDKSMDAIIGNPICLRVWVMHDSVLSADNSALQNLEAFREMCANISHDELREKVAKAAKIHEIKDKSHRVALSSIHRAKGMEWEEVYIAGCNQDIIPHKSGSEEEERRLMYVAMTRAKDTLIMTSQRDKDVSQFVEEITDHLDHDTVAVEGDDHEHTPQAEIPAGRIPVHDQTGTTTV